MKTVIETATFTKNAEREWWTEERLAFVSWIAVNPLAGDVIPSVEGVRKVRWSVKGAGKSGGVRVVYYNIDQDLLLLIDIYRKNKIANTSASEIKKVR